MQENTAVAAQQLSTDKQRSSVTSHRTTKREADPPHYRLVHCSADRRTAYLSTHDRGGGRAAVAASPMSAAHTRSAAVEACHSQQRWRRSQWVNTDAQATSHRTTEREVNPAQYNAARAGAQLTCAPARPGVPTELVECSAIAQRSGQGSHATASSERSAPAHCIAGGRAVYSRLTSDRTRSSRSELGQCSADPQYNGHGMTQGAAVEAR
jgi:hypothetical protein